jgi:hypothetical protein
MVALPLSILALAAGVYLLIKVKREYLSGLFSILAWLIIVASLISIGFSSVRALHDRHHGGCGNKEECRMEKRIVIKEDGAGSCHGMGKGECNMEGCRMEGDSCIMDKVACEKMLGKEACDAIEKERGRCIMSKEECMKMCHGEKAMGGCSMDHGESMPEGKNGCCKEGEKKECCKKKVE